MIEQGFNVSHLFYLRYEVWRVEILTRKSRDINNKMLFMSLEKGNPQYGQNFHVYSTSRVHSINSKPQ